MTVREAHTSVAPAEVRGTRLRSHDARRRERGDVYLTLAAEGRPRLWGYALDACIQGFSESLESTAGQSPPERMERAVKGARGALVNACNALVEKQVPDAHLCALWFDVSRLYVVNVGRGRVYLHRGGRPERLTSRDDAVGGLLASAAQFCERPLKSRDLVLFGSETAFSTTAIGRVATVLQDDPLSPTSVLASLLTEPAFKAGQGAAAGAVRPDV